MSIDNKIVLKKANLEDIDKEVEFIKKVPLVENGFANFFYNVLHMKNEDILKFCLTLRYSNENIPIYTYFLWVDNKIVGMYHLLSRLTEDQKQKDGHISYTILKEYRGKGYATKGLSLMIEEAKNIIPEDEIYMHTTINNPASLRIMLKNNAYVIKQDDFGIFTPTSI